jgi:hypothetical protein
MKKRKNTKSQKALNAADRAMIVFCLSGAFLFFWFFWQDLNRALNRNQAPAGTITFKKGGAQRRLGDRVLWDRLRQESPVYDEDLIRTADLSDATITFAGGEKKFSLSENSLIRIRTVGGQKVIDLAAGDVTVENPGPGALVLVSGTRQVELSGTMKVRAGEDGSFGLEVLEGHAVISGGEERIVREAGEVFFLDSQGRTIERPRVVMLLPRPGEEFTGSGETLRVDFSWIPVGFSGAERTRLEIAGDRRFIRPLKNLDTESSRASVELPPGTYWWRAYASSSGPEDVSPEKLTILPPVAAPLIPVIAAPVLPEIPVEPAPPPPPRERPVPEKPVREKPPPESPGPQVVRLPAVTERRPENGCRIGPDQIRQSRSLTFSWKETPGANGYIFTLREDSGRVIFSSGPRPETSCTLDLRLAGRGTFLWQVEAVRQNGGIIEQRGTAAENRFTVDIPLPGNPRLREPGPLYGSGSS